MDACDGCTNLGKKGLADSFAIYGRGREIFRPPIQLRSIRNLSARMGWVVSTMAQLLYPWEGPGTHCTEGCVDLGAGVGKQKIMRPRDSISSTNYSVQSPQ
jgi:hypothetical protein